jgi:hypothetical protein
VPRPNGVCRLKSRSLFVSHSGNLHSVVLTNAWAFATPLARGPCSPSIGNFSKDSRLAQIDRQRRAERNSDFRSTMAALGGSPVRFHLAKSRNCGLLPISPKRTEGLCLLAGEAGFEPRRPHHPRNPESRGSLEHANTTQDTSRGCSDVE